MKEEALFDAISYKGLVVNDKTLLNEEQQDEERRKRINRLIETLGLSQRAFALNIGESPGNLNKVMLGRRAVPNSLPSKIVNVYKEVRIDWLLYGEGEMYEKDQHLADAEALKKHMELLPTKPRLPKNMSECHLEQYYNEKKRVLCQEKPVVYQFADYDFSLILKNNRMSPKYERGDELFFKKALFPEWGNDFLLDTSDGPKFKRIYDNGDSVRCVSYNKEEYPDFEVPKELICGYYRCVGVLRIL